ncbi:MAG: 5-formyltetrahydrofolate cyclo-ligase [Fibrobacter sp.]|nr:5-formyltetrahydrofolate cyclo-ligase [Fibrobacter sp.]
MEAALLILLFIVVLGARGFFDPAKRKRPGEELINNPWEEIHAIPGYKESRKVAAFYPLKGEPNITPVLEQLVRENRLLLPRVTGETTMEFYPIDNLKKDLAPGRFGIMEPRADIPPYTGPFTVFLVPGTKFNVTGLRQGHGKGYYDRFLAKHPDAYKAGIATPKQIQVEPLEQKETDIRMNQVIVCRAKE